MIVTIHQPDFIPWLGFFSRWAKSDLFILLDDVQFLRRGWHHRDRIKTQHGAHWLTIPIKKKGKYSQLINEVEIDNSNDWCCAHLETLKHAYSRAPYYQTVIRELEKVYQVPGESLRDFNIGMLKCLAQFFHINTEICLSSDLKVGSSSAEKLIKLVKAVKGKTYLTGMGSKAYLEEKLFQEENIHVIWEDYQQPQYEQLHGDFSSNLSAIDYLMMCGSMRFS
jgi:hypothetical protein